MSNLPPRLVLLVGVCLLASVALPLSAQNLRVEYIEGLLELGTASGWKELAPGDTLPPSARIRLDRDGLAELAQGATRIAVSQPGTYLVSDLLRASKKVASWQLASVVGGKIKGAIAGGQKSDTAVMGARGAKQGEPANIEWVEAGGAGEAVAQGKALIDSGRYEEALKTFQKALQEAYAGEEGTLLYYLAAVYSLQGRTALALRALDPVNIQPQESLYTDMVLLKGRLLLESLAFNDALQLFSRQLKVNPEGDFAQALLILSSYSYRGLGQTAGAREALEKALQMNGSSELGKEASLLLEEL
jgi:tetratricopeptide (TPR) repeat protein